jgi:peptidoglycan/LPS O-acetylase OafA/YrhL
MLAASTMGLLTQDADLGFVFLQGSCFACAYALAVLLILRRLLGNTPIRPNSPIDLLAKDSFGIYVLHPLFVHLALMKIDPMAFPPVVFELGFIAIVIAASMALTRLLRRVPFLGDLL